MTVQRRKLIFHHRDSGGKHETTPGEYVQWAAATVEKHDADFNGTPELIKEMIESGEFERGDLYVDYDVSGFYLERRGLDALFDRLEHDPNVRFVMVARRDRLARPDDPLDGTHKPVTGTR